MFTRPGDLDGFSERRSVQTARICAAIFLLLSALMIARVQESRRNELMERHRPKIPPDSSIPWINSSDKCSDDFSRATHFYIPPLGHGPIVLTSMVANPKAGSGTHQEFLSFSKGQLDFGSLSATLTQTGPVFDSFLSTRVSVNATDHRKEDKRKSHNKRRVVSLAHTTNLHKVFDIGGCRESDFSKNFKPAQELSGINYTREMDSCVFALQELDREACRLGIWNSPFLDDQTGRDLSSSCDYYLSGKDKLLAGATKCYRLVAGVSVDNILERGMSPPSPSKDSRLDPFLNPFCGRIYPSTLMVDSQRGEISIMMRRQESINSDFRKKSNCLLRIGLEATFEKQETHANMLVDSCLPIPSVDINTVDRFEPSLSRGFGSSPRDVISMGGGLRMPQQVFRNNSDIGIEEEQSLAPRALLTPFLTSVDRSGKFLTIYQTSPRRDRVIMTCLDKQTLELKYSLEFFYLSSGWILDIPSNAANEFALILGDVAPYNRILEAVELKSGQISRHYLTALAIRRTTN